MQNQYEEVYDVRGNVLETYSQPQNGTWQKTASFTYSPRGLLLSQADGKGQVTSFAYDNANNLIKTTLADGSETQYTYAKANNPKDMIQKSEGEEFIYHRTYNNLGMLKSAWQSGGEGAHQPYSYTYNLWGGLQSVTDPKGQATTYGYDTLGNATTITKTDETLTYKYNQFGKVDLAQRVRNGQTETADYEYSNLGYLTKKTENGKVLTYTYDLYGKVLSMTDQLGMTTAYEYNDKNQITKVTADGKEFTYSYYPNGLVQSLTYPASKNGTKVATNYTYDNAGRLTNVSTPALNESYSYSYDENSNINGVNNNVEFFYDEVNRIAMSNFKSVGNTQNLYSYDGRGNIKNHVSNKTLPSPKPYTYTYDASNRVKEVSNGSTTVASYDYDVEGTRNRKVLNNTITEYYTANGDVLAEKTGSTERHNVWTDRILARKDGTIWYYLIYDGLNDVRKVITDSASIVANYTYDEWGNILEKSGSYANQNPIRYKGEYFDDETGFIYLRARYYDPTIGRFITEDPILDGQNWYVYCGNNPVMLVDSTGLYSYSELSGTYDKMSQYGWVYTLSTSGGRTVFNRRGFQNAQGAAVEHIKYLLDCLVPDSEALYYTDKLKILNKQLSGVRNDVTIGPRTYLMLLNMYNMGNRSSYNPSTDPNNALYDTSNDSVTEDVVLNTVGAIPLAILIKCGFGGAAVPIGTTFGSLGTLIASKPNITVNWAITTTHAIERMAQRNVTPAMVENWMKTGKVLQQSGNKFLYIARQGAVVIDNAGKLITTYSSAQFDSTMQSIVQLLFK